MALKIFEDKKIPDLITKTKDELPDVSLLKQDLDFGKLIEEFVTFRDEFLQGMWTNIEYKNKVTNEQIEDLNSIHWWGENQSDALYFQFQMARTNNGRWDELFDGIGEYTRDVLSSFGKIHRPRYVVVKPGWDVLAHQDWEDTYQHGFRVHLMISTNDQCTHSIHDGENRQDYHFQNGEAWFFNVQNMHSARNLGGTDRISISFELLSDSLI